MRCLWKLEIQLKNAYSKLCEFVLDVENKKKFSEKVTLDSILINIEYRDKVGQEDTIITLRSYVYSSKESFLKIPSIIKNGGKANNDLSNIMLSTSF